MYLADYRRVGSVRLSSRYFRDIVVDAALRMSPQYQRHIFVGIGSGVIADEILRRSTRRFTFVEQVESFGAAFRERHRRARPEVVVGEFSDLVLTHQLDVQNALVVSCAPVSGMFYNERMREAMLACLRARATVLQMSYSIKPRLSRFFRELNARHVAITAIGGTLLNVPPAFLLQMVMG